MVDEDGSPIELSDVEKEGDGGVGDEGLLAGREGEPPLDVKAQVHEAEGASAVQGSGTAKRKRAAKGTEAEVKPKGEETIVNDDLTPAEAVQQVKELDGPTAKSAPKKRGRKSTDAP